MIAASLVFALLAKKPAPPPPKDPASLRLEVVRDRIDDVERLDARLDAPLVAAAVVAGPGPSRTVVVLAETAPAPGPSPSPAPCAGSADRPAAPKRLLVLDVDAAAWRPLRSDLPADAVGLAVADLDGDGAEDLILERADGLDLVPRGPEGAWTEPLRPLLRSPSQTPLPTSITGSGRSARLAIPSPGMLRLYAPAGRGAALEPAGSAPIPLQAIAAATELDLRAPWPSSAPGSRSGPWFTPPEAVGKDRLRFRMLAPEDPVPETRSVECWARLPDPERVLDSGFVLLDGAPALVVTSMNAEKLAVLGAKRLRVYRPQADRTRSGAAPILAAETSLNLWQSTSPRARDANGDGRDDLVLPHWKGLKSTLVAFDVFLRKADGSFEDSPKSSEIDVEDGDRSFLDVDDDYDGDALADLVVRTKKGFEIRRGLRETRGGKRLFEAEPWKRAAAPEGLAGTGSVLVGFGTEGFQTFNNGARAGDPRPWILVPGKAPALAVTTPADRDGRGRVVIFRF